MTIKDCIDIIDSNKPNQYTITDKVRWLSFIEEIIINDVLKTHEGYDGRYDEFTGYSDDKISVTLIVPSPYDRLYTAYLKMKIDEENGETARYNNSAVMFNTYLTEYKKHYNKTHMPLSNDKIRGIVKNKVNQVKGLTDAEMENLKNELTYILTEYFSNTISEDKVYDVVTKYMQNNLQVLKGEDGKTPIKGQDYFTVEDIRAITDELTKYAKDEIQVMSKGFENTLREINIKYNNLSSAVDSQLPNKVDKVEGMGLSEVNYTTSDQHMLYELNKMLYNAVQTLANKVDAAPGKGLSEENYTNQEKVLLSELAVQVNEHTTTLRNILKSISNPVRSFIYILGGKDNWRAENVTDSAGNVIGVRYGQVVDVNGATITPYSKVDLQLTSDQMVVFYEKSLAFVAENDNGVVKVYCVGSIPENNYMIQAIVTEVVVDG